MIRRSRLTIVIVLSLVAALGLVLFLRRSQQPLVSSRAQPENSAAFFPASDAPVSETIDMGAKRGTIAVKNFYKGALGQEGDTVLLKKGNGYEITYNRLDSSFGIMINAAPIATTLAAAEGDLLSLLGISQQDVCALNVSWNVAYGLDSKYPFGQSFPLSFCPPR